MIKLDVNMVLRIGFGIFFLMWGIDRIRRVDHWASDQFLGSFYGSSGSVAWLVIAVGIVQVLVGLAFFANIKVKMAALISLAIMATSLVVTIGPMAKYIWKGGSPIPSFLFVDHFPLLAGAWAIYATADI